MMSRKPFLHATIVFTHLFFLYPIFFDAMLISAENIKKEAGSRE